MAGLANRKMKLHYGQHPGGGGGAVSQRKYIRLGVMIILVNLALYISVFGGGSNFDKAKEKQRKKQIKKLRRQKRKQNRLRKKSNTIPKKGTTPGTSQSQASGSGIETGTVTTNGGGNGDDGVSFS